MQANNGVEKMKIGNKTVVEWGRKIVKGIIIAIAIYVGIHKQWKQVVSACLCLILLWGYPKILKQWGKIELKEGLQLYLDLFILATQGFGSILGFYDKFFWWDIALHTLSGILFFLIGLEVIQQIHKKTEKTAINYILAIFFGITFSLAIGAIWEMLEYIIDSITKGNMQRTIGKVEHEALTDTMEDLLAGALGTGITAFVMCKRGRF